MTNRTTREFIAFPRPFQLRGMARMCPAGSYEIMTEAPHKPSCSSGSRSATANPGAEFSFRPEYRSQIPQLCAVLNRPLP